MRRAERGIALVLTAIIGVVLVLVVLLMVGTSYLASGRASLLNTANLVALAAIEGYTRTNLEFEKKVIEGGVRANFFLRQNAVGIKGLQGSWGDNALTVRPLEGGEGEGGFIEFGRWIPDDTDNLHLCGEGIEKYPCFIHFDNVDPSNEATAVRVSIKTRAGRFLAPLAGDLGIIREDALAVVVPRCWANVVDLSYSSAEDTFPALPTAYAGPYTTPRPYPTPQASYVITDPPAPQAALFAYREEQIDDLHGRNNCYGSPASDYLRPRRDKFFWCNMFEQRSNPPPGYTSEDHHIHFRSDYEHVNLPLGDPDYPNLPGPIMVDKFVRPNIPGEEPYLGPEPFTRFMSAMNAGIRLAREQSAPGDKSLLLGFRGEMVARVPRQGGLTDELNLLVQVTNLLNRGTYKWAGDYVQHSPEVHPNFLEYGFIPIFAYYPADQIISGTNIPLALSDAMVKVADVTQCSPIASKSIVIATDGLGTCLGDYPDHPDQNIHCDNTDFGLFRTQERDLMEKSYSRSMMNRLISARVSLTAIVDGKGVSPRYRNKAKPGGGYYSFDEARALPGPEGDALRADFFDVSYECGTRTCNGTCSEECAYMNFGQSGVAFRRPIRSLAAMAFETGGQVCPVLPTCSSTDHLTSTCALCSDNGAPNKCYESEGDPPKIRDCARQGANLGCSLTFESRSAQAARCVVNTIGSNPFALRYVSAANIH